MNPVDTYAALKQAVLGAQANPQATGSPLGNFPELNQYYALPNAAAHSKLANTGGNYNTGVTDANNQAAAKEAQANEIDDLQAKAQSLSDANDPSKFQQVAKPDGGYAFYDGAGNEISAFDYARATGKSPADVLKNSTNPIDIGFNQDYKQLQDYINAKANSKNDPSAAQTAKNIEAAVQKSQGVNLAKMNIQDVINRFKQAYPTVFGGTNRGIPVGQTLIAPKTVLPAGGVGG